MEYYKKIVQFTIISEEVHTVKSQLQTAVFIDYFDTKNIQKASIQGRLLIEFRKIALKLQENILLPLLM